MVNYTLKEQVQGSWDLAALQTNFNFFVNITSLASNKHKVVFSRHYVTMNFSGGGPSPEKANHPPEGGLHGNREFFHENYFPHPSWKKLSRYKRKKIQREELKETGFWEI